MRKEIYGRRRGHNDFVAAFSSLSLGTSDEIPQHPSKARDSREQGPGAEKLISRQEDKRIAALLVSPSVEFVEEWNVAPLEPENQQEHRRAKKKTIKASNVSRRTIVGDGSNVLQERSHNAEARKKESEDQREGTATEAVRRQNADNAAELRNPPSIAGHDASVGCHARKPRGRPRKDRATLHKATGEPFLPRGLDPLRSIIQSAKKVSRFSDFYADVADQFTLRKINQGSYGSVYASTLHEDEESQTVWKVMPLRRDNEKRQREDWRTRFKDLIAEAKLLLALSGIDGFVQMREVHLTQGTVPDGLKMLDQAWFHSIPLQKQEEIGQTFEQMAWGEGQWWCWFEMSYAGLDLENWLSDKRRAHRMKQSLEDASTSKLPCGPVSILEAWDIFWSVAETLSCAELDLEFEHRDLHSGNVCVRQFDGRPKRHEQAEGDGAMGIERMANLEATLIDYSISRARIPLGNAGDDEIIAIAPEDIFDQEAPLDDREAEHQYLIYDTMFEIMEDTHPTAQSRKSGWQSFMPRTNLLWLEHLLRLLLTETGEYDPHDWTIVERDRTPKEDEAVDTLLLILQSLDPERWTKWEFESASQLVENQLLIQQEMAQTR